MRKGIIQLAVFLIVMICLHGIRFHEWMDIKLLEFYLIIGTIASIALRIKKERFSYTLLGGTIVGYLVEWFCYSREGNHPSMQGATYNMAIIILAFFIGLFIESKKVMRNNINH